MLFLCTVIFLAFTLESASATAFAQRDPGRLACLRNAVIVRVLRDPRNSADAKTFCSNFIQSTRSVAVTATATRIISTETITPDPVILTETITSFTTITATPLSTATPALVEKRQNQIIPPYLSRFREDRIRNACVCIAAPSTITTTRIITQTLDDIATTTVQASTITTTVISTQVVTETPSICSVDSFEPRVEDLPEIEFSVFQGEHGFTDESVNGGKGRWIKVLYPSRSPTVLMRTIRTCPGVIYDLSLYLKFDLGTRGLFTASYHGIPFLTVDSTTIPNPTVFAQARGVFTGIDDLTPFALSLANLSPTREARLVIDDIVITPRSAVDSASGNPSAEEGNRNA